MGDKVSGPCSYRDDVEPSAVSETSIPLPSIRSANSPPRSPTHSTARAVRGRRRTRFAKARRCSKPQRAAAASIWRIQDGATVLCLRGPLVPLTQSRFHCQRCSAPSSLRINLEPRAVNAMSIPPGQHPPDLPLDRRLAGCHLRLSRRTQCQPQTVCLDQIRRRHSGQTRSLPCTIRLSRCTSGSGL